MSIDRSRAAFRALLCLLVLGAGARAQDLGFEGPSYSGYHAAQSPPSGTKPQSKLWFADGKWWGCLWSAAVQSFMIHCLDPGTQSWIDTGTPLDGRSTSLADCLWDGAKLYVASHRFTTGSGYAGHPMFVYRMGYDPATQLYSLDSGFPVQVAETSTKTMLIEKDSTGTLWAAWMYGFRVRVAHTLSDDRTWSAPIVLPACTSDVTSSDICSLVRFQNNRIGVLWSDEASDAFRFSQHLDGDPDTTWSASEAVLSGPGMADDHINLKASSDGRVFALLKTGTDEIRLMVRSTSGVWSSHLVGAAVDGWTRAIVLLDEEEDEVHCFATRPSLGGTIYEKVAALGTLSFPSGVGTPVIQMAADPTHNDATSTRQNLSGETGLVVLASHTSSQHYWHHYDDLGGAVAAPPVASFHADRTQGFAPLPVQFLDASTGLPTAWSWDFGDGDTSNERHPRHVYSTPGLYSVSLEASNGLGSDTLLRSDLVSVDAAPTALLLTALEDSQVREGVPSANYGALTSLRVRDTTDDFHTYLKFQVPATGNLVTGAVLRLFVTDGSPDGGSVYPVESTWTEAGITWQSAPALTGAPLGALGLVTLNTWAQLDVSAAVDDDGLFSFGIANTSTNSAIYSSREGANPPELSLTLQAPLLPEADFSAGPTIGVAPLVVQFIDGSNGGPIAWSWDFGDGATSNAQNPSHVYHAGLFTVSLEVQNENGSDTKTVNGYVRVRPHVKHANPIQVSGPRVTSVPFGAQGAGWTTSAELSMTLEDAGLWVANALPGCGFEVRRLPTTLDAAADYLLTRGERSWTLRLLPGVRGTRAELWLLAR